MREHNHSREGSGGDPTYGLTMSLSVVGLSASYGRVPALVDLNLQVGAGEVLALIGPNGAGKSSALRAVSGLLRPGSGRVTVAGEEITGRSPAAVVAHGVVLVPAGRRVFTRLSVRENLAVGAHLATRSAATAALARVHRLFPVLAERAGQPAGTLSGGEQQQLAFGRALMAGPRVLLLDEPTTGLAAGPAERLLGAVREVAAEGVAVLLVERAGVALRTAGRGVVLDTGRVVAVGTSEELLRDHERRGTRLGG